MPCLVLRLVARSLGLLFYLFKVLQMRSSTLRSSTSRRALRATFAVLGALSLGAACGPAPEADLARTSQAIVNGQFDSGHEAVGALLQSQGSLCTATLVGQRTVLTAAHCVEPGFSHVFMLGDDRWNVDKVVRHPDYDQDVVGGADVAIARLRYAPPVQAARIGVLPPEPASRSRWSVSAPRATAGAARVSSAWPTTRWPRSPPRR